MQTVGVMRTRAFASSSACKNPANSAASRLRPHRMPPHFKAGSSTHSQSRRVSTSTIRAAERTIDPDIPYLGMPPATATAPHAETSAGKGNKGGVVIVGGGPAGMSAALMLAHRGWSDITVLERQASVQFNEPDRSYVYAIDGRSRKLLDQLGLSEQLGQHGVDIRQADITRVLPDGKVKVARIPIKDDAQVTHWMPRRAFMGLLERAARSEPYSSAIRIMTCASFVAMEREQQGPCAAAGAAGPGSPSLAVRVQQQQEDGSTAQLTLRARLVLGCDGVASAVRGTLAAWQQQDEQQSSQQGGGFAMTELPSPSAGLRYKVLLLPPNPETRSGHVLANPGFAVVQGSRACGLRMGLLPVKDSSAQRPANIITRPDHPFWQVCAASEMYAYLGSAFPQLDFRQLVGQEDMERYAASRGGRFPAPQYCSQLAWTVRPAAREQQGEDVAAAAAPAAGSGSAVVLLGDAVHCFPPDLGQGVNSALEDVAVLGAALEQSGSDVAAAAARFQVLRAGDAQALARLVQLGYPWQYAQSALRQRLWTLKFLLLTALNKVLPVAFSPPIFLMVQQSQLSYSTILTRAQATSRSLVALLAAAAVVLAALLLRKALAAS